MKEGKVIFYPCHDGDFLIKSPNSLFKWSQVSLITRGTNCSYVHLNNDAKSGPIAETLDFFQQIREWALNNRLIFETSDHIASIRNFVCIGRDDGDLVARFNGDHTLGLGESLLNDFCLALVKEEGEKNLAECRQQYEKKVA